MRDKDVMMDDWGKDVQRLSQQLRRNLERERERERERDICGRREHL